MSVFAFLLLLSADPLPCRADKDGYCTDKIVRHAISYESEKNRVKINCALGDVVSIAFPEGVELRGEPALGNRAIFQFRAQTDPFRILVWPKYPEGTQKVAPAELEGERSNLQVFLDSGVTVLLDLKIAPAVRSVQQITFEFPERSKESEFVRTHVDALARRLEEDYLKKQEALDSEVEDKARRRLARAMLDRLDCESLSERAMNDLLVVRAHRICRVSDLVFIVFSVQNRARDVFHLDRVEVAPSESSEAGGHERPLVEFEGETTLAFNQEAEGVAVFAAGNHTPSSYLLTVYEDGGKKRVVRVDDVEF